MGCTRKTSSSVTVPEIVEYETAARNQLLSKQPEVLVDKISRAMALLRNAHLISSQEALFLLSHLRMGINMHERMGASTPAIDGDYVYSLGRHGIRVRKGRLGRMKRGANNGKMAKGAGGGQLRGVMLSSRTFFLRVLRCMPR